MRYHVILVPDENGVYSVSVPAMPGCFSAGRTIQEALANVQDAMDGWLACEAAQGRGPLDDTPDVIGKGVAEALELLAEMREAGDIPADHPDRLELATVTLQRTAAA